MRYSLALLAVVAATTVATPAQAMGLLDLQLDAPTLGSELKAKRLLSEAGDLTLHVDTENFPGMSGGGAGGNDLMPVLALLLGLFIGFGLGHLIAGDNGGFTNWLIIDIILLVVIIAVDVLILGPLLTWRVSLRSGVLSLLWFVAHIFQGLDAMSAAGGSNPLKGAAEDAFEPVYANTNDKGRVLLPTTPVLSLAF